ncbi:uncharacterized protein LOC100273627 [Zea mays]|uniref:Lectin-like protein n=2 Tax=Zea mays TaxID=4577 RepID=K7UYP0_MAIZE|nr:uncharacterized protein LOC100273627 [Zea mays]AQK90339.1 Lectin-like protein [Zea mays]|eukprot:NP_001141515.2 uncharacterized protein LOC100273627 [Zea mays]
MGLALSRLEEIRTQYRMAAEDGEADSPAPAPVSPTGAAAASGGGTEKKKQADDSSSSSKTTEWVPHKFSEIVGQRRPGEDMFRGIYLPRSDQQPKTKKYWVDGRNANCFMLFPKGFSITWGSDARYWSWRKLTQEEKREIDPEEAKMEMEVAYLKDVCWLEIRAKLEMSHLTPGFTYVVDFVAKLEQNGYGWSEPVDLQINCPGDVDRKPRKESLWKTVDGKKWSYVNVGEVEAAGQNGEMEIAMLRLGGDWKRGLVLRCIKITPKP